MVNKRLVWIALSLILVTLFSACSKEQQVENANDDVVATVNNQEILASEYNEVFSRLEMMYAGNGLDLTSEENKEMLEMLQEQAMDEVINTTLLTQAANKEGFEATDEEVAENLATIKSQFADDAEFQSQLEAAGYTVSRFEKEIKTSIVIDKYLSANLPAVSITDEEIQDMFSFYELQSEEELDIEDYRPMIEEELKYQKEQQEFAKILEELKANSEIVIL